MQAESKSKKWYQRWWIWAIVILFIIGKTTDDSGNSSNSSSTRSSKNSNGSCKDDIKAYQFGRDMYQWVALRNAGLDLDDAINEYSETVMDVRPIYADNDCVEQGYQDASEGITSPYDPSNSH